MLVRKLVTCNACSGAYLLRFGVGLGFEQRLAWPCPICKAETRAHFSVKQDVTDADFKSQDIVIHKEEPLVEGLPGINLYSEIPVHKSSFGKSLVEGGSAWLRLGEFLKGSGFEEFVVAKESMSMLRLYAFPHMRRAAGYYKRHEWMRLQKILKNTDCSAFPIILDRHPVYQFGRFFDTSFVPILDFEEKIASGSELMDLLNRADLSYQPEYTLMLRDAFESQGFVEARNRCLDSALLLFDHYDSLILPLATERFSPEWRERIYEFRVFRDDFEVLRLLYMNIFESMNQHLVWLGMLANLANRGDTCNWYNGDRASFRTASKWKAFEREFIMRELPECEKLLSKASRGLRNRIGHNSVRYDVTSGSIEFGSGERISLLLFHEDLLASARLLSVLLTLGEKLTLDVLRLVYNEPMIGWNSSAP